MLPTGLLTPERLELGASATSKKRVLEKAAELLVGGQTTPEPHLVFEKLLERERLGSTGLANGIALPHARIAEVREARGAFMRLQQSVDFDALDGQPVDLVFALLVPENATQEHLDLLANLAKLFSDKELCEKIRNTSETQQVLQLLVSGNAATDDHTGAL